VSVFLTLFLASLLALVAVVILVSSVVGQMRDVAIDQQIQHDGRDAGVVYTYSLRDLLQNGLLIAKDPTILNRFDANDNMTLRSLLKTEADLHRLEQIYIVDENASVLASADGSLEGQQLSLNHMVERSLTGDLPVVSNALLPQELLDSSPNLLLQARILKIPTLYYQTLTPDAPEDSYVTGGLSGVAVVPIVRDGRVAGALVLVDLINRDSALVDKIKETLGDDVTIYQGDVAVSTTLLTQQGNRLVGLRLPAPVSNSTLAFGEEFLGREWSGNQWVRVDALPLRDQDGVVIGALSVFTGEVDAGLSVLPYPANIMTIILLVLCALVLCAIGVSLVIAHRISTPIDLMIDSAAKVAEGDLEQGVTIESYEEFNRLAATFDVMIRRIRKQMIQREQDVIGEYRKMTRKEKESDKEKEK